MWERVGDKNRLRPNIKCLHACVCVCVCVALGIDAQFSLSHMGAIS